MAAPATMDENIRKYEEIGTHPAANHNAISVALAFHQAIGGERKVARLRYLRDRWARRVHARERSLPPPHPARQPAHGGHRRWSTSKAWTPDQLVAWLMNRHRIVTTPISHAEFNGLRITPNVYTTTREVDLFADALLQAVRHGIS